MIPQILYLVHPDSNYKHISLYKVWWNQCKQFDRVE